MMSSWRNIALALFCLLMSHTLQGSVESILKTIEKRSCETDSDIVLIVYQGKQIAAFGKALPNTPIETRSITKSFVSLAIGILIDEGKIESIDTPVYNFFPEWNQGIRQGVTIRHLLTHTSGMENGEEMSEIQVQPDIVKMALSTDFVCFPGTLFSYNNKATNLLAAIVAKVTGSNVQNYLRCRLFIPLGITSDTWLCDVSGNQFGMSYLSMSAADLAKVGTLIAQQGCWGGRQLISEQWIVRMMGPSQEFTPFYSLLWWLDYNSICLFWDKPLIELYQMECIPEQYLRAFKCLRGQSITISGPISNRNFRERVAERLEPYFECKQEVINCLAQIEAIGLPLARWQNGQLRTISARGYMGQQLIINSEANLIAVRLTRSVDANQDWEDQCPDKFHDLEFLLDDLAAELNGARCDLEVFNCGTDIPPPLPKMYYCESDPEFQKPYFFGREVYDQKLCEDKIPHIDPRTIPYYTPPVPEEIKFDKPVEGHVLHGKEVKAKPAQDFDFGSAFEGTVHKVEPAHSLKNPPSASSKDQ